MGILGKFLSESGKTRLQIESHGHGPELRVSGWTVDNVEIEVVFGPRNEDYEQIAELLRPTPVALISEGVTPLTPYMQVEHSAWMEVVRRFQAMGLDMNDENTDAGKLAKAIQVWGEQLAILRAQQTSQDRAGALQDRLHEYRLIQNAEKG